MKWEYKQYIAPRTQMVPEENELNTLGKEGWELINIIDSEQAGFGAICYFKRPIQSPKKVIKVNKPPKQCNS